jgi:phenylacetate-coenzyme A ligase PaaK-like adenylate-forming protein
VYITNLYNHVLPLIRFELTDEVTVLQGCCPCGSRFRTIADTQGRLDDTFVYPSGAMVHPHLFRSVLAQHQEIVEYQVRQTTSGAEIAMVAESDSETAHIAYEIEHALAVLKLPNPSVTVTRVAALDRQTTGKLKRFLPLPANGSP